MAEWRVPDLVGEVADTTLATDLDEKKHLYSALRVPEYWVVEVEGGRVLAFQLQQEGLPITLLEETIRRLTQGTTDSAASWFAEQVEEL